MSNINAEEKGLVAGCPQCGQKNRMSYGKLGETFRCGKCHADLKAPEEPVELGSEAVFEAVTGQAALPVVVDFWAPWCGPCKMVAPEFAKVAREQAGRWLVAKVNTEEVPGPSQRFRISAIPTFVVFKGGREVARQSGAMGAAAIRQFVEKAL